MLPIAYIVRVETTGEDVIQQASPQIAEWDPGAVLAAESARPCVES